MKNFSFVAILAAVLCMASCGGNSSPAAPSTPTPTPTPVSTIKVDGLGVTPSVAHAGDTITVYFNTFLCPTGFRWGVLYTRDDGVTRPPNGASCVIGGSSSGAMSTILNEQNDMLSFSRGHTLKAELVVMEVYPVPIWRSLAGSVSVQ